MKTTFATLAFALLFAVSASAQVIIHESDFEAEPATGFGIGSETMLFTDGGGDLIGFSANNNTLTSGDALGISDANPNSGSFHYAVDSGATTSTGGTPPGSGNGWGGSWNGANTENGSGGFTTPAAATENGNGCYVDFVAGTTFTVSAMVATDALDPLTGTGVAEIRLEFNNITVTDNGDGTTTTDTVPDVIARAVSPVLGAADLTAAYQPITMTYTITADDIAAADFLGTPINSVVGVMGTNEHGDGNTDGMIYFDDFVFEVSESSVVLVGEGHVEVNEPSCDVNLDGSVNFSDISPFIAALASPVFLPSADCNGDGAVNFSDISPFIAALAAQP